MNTKCTVFAYAKKAFLAIGVFSVLFEYINSAQSRKFARSRKKKSIISRLCVFIRDNK